MSFIRPEVQETLFRFRETIVGTVLVALGIYWTFAGIGLLKYLGVALILAATLLVIAGLQRAKFRVGRGGAGVVQVTEHQISYYGPLTGGAVSIDAMTQLELDPRQKPAHWVLRQAGQDPLHIPITAEGADALFDAFGALPKINTTNMLAQLKNQSDQPVVIWQKIKPRLH